MGDRGAALGAEPTVDCVSGVGGALPLLDGPLGLELVFGDNDYEGCSFTKNESEVSIKVAPILYMYAEDPMTGRAGAHNVGQYENAGAG